MKKVLASLLILSTLATALTSCDSPDQYRVNSKKDPTEIEQTIPIVYPDTKNVLGKDIKAILSTVDIPTSENTIGCSHAVGLMDLDFDGVPEVLVAYPGGSMGNVFVQIYNLKTHKKIADYNAAHYGSTGGLRLYVAKTETKYVTLAEGTFRDPESGFCNTISQLQIDDNNTLKLKNLFATAEKANSLGQGPYFVLGKHAEKAQYDEEYQCFLNDYQKVESTELQLIWWSSLVAETKEQLVSQMTNALLSTSQKFVDWKAAYLDVIEIKKDDRRAYALAFIDGDEVPELYVKGIDQAEGDCIYSYKNGQLAKLQLERIGGGRYIEYSGEILNQNGTTGTYCTDVYKLNKNGCTKTFFGEEHRKVTLENGNYTTVSTYMIGGRVVSEAEFNAAVNEAFDLEKSIRFSDIEVSYSTIVHLLTVSSDGDGTAEDSVKPDWQTAYLDVIQENLWEYVSFSLVYIDDDDVPELYMSGACEASGDRIYTYKNGRLAKLQLKRIGGGRYVERTGAIINVNGHMGRYYTDVYKLDENGFTDTFSGIRTERVEQGNLGKSLVNEEYNIITEYTIAGEVVSEAEFDAAVNEAFDFEHSVDFYDSAVSYSLIIRQIAALSTFEGK